MPIALYDLPLLECVHEVNGVVRRVWLRHLIVYSIGDEKKNEN